jgi:catechol 2,3-dioxygenase-like lactoylglutathione lyase family enzyme
MNDSLPLSWSVRTPGLAIEFIVLGDWLRELCSRSGRSSEAALNSAMTAKIREGYDMTAQLNHTIVYSSDHTKSARFLAEILGLPAPVQFGPFQVVELGNGVSLDFAAADGPIQPQHYAFLISEADFDAVFGRIGEQGLKYWADPMRSRLCEINHNDGGRGVYFDDPDGHYLEVITRPYGSGSS